MLEKLIVITNRKNKGIYEKFMRLFTWCINHCLGQILLKWYYFLRHHKVLYKIPIESILDYCVFHKLDMIHFVPKEKQESILEHSNDVLAKLVSNVERDVHDIYSCVLHNASVCGENDSILMNHMILNDRCLFLRDKAINVPDYCIGISRNTKIALAEQVVPERKIKYGIFLLGRWPGNWWHLTFEILSRLQYCDELESYRDWPIIVDEVVLSDASNKKLLEKMNIRNREVISIEKGQLALVEQLLYVSCPVVETLDSMKYPHLSSVRDNIAYIRKCVVGEQKKEIIADKRYFVVRRKNDRLINESELEKIFQENGFEVVCMEGLSFEEEVNVFSTAKCLVSTLGGAMTNMIYCTPGAKVVCIYPTECISPVEFYQNIANSIGVKFFLCNAEIHNEKGSYDTIKYSLDISQCRKLIDALLER